VIIIMIKLKRLLFSLKNNRKKKTKREQGRVVTYVAAFIYDFFPFVWMCFVFSLNFTAVDNLFVCVCICSRKTCSVAKFDYAYNTKNDEGISSGACKKLNLSSLSCSFSMNEGWKEKTNCAYNMYTSSI
jgi:hypothetical protein